jgi:AraC-like DNA-binding protein
MKVTASPFRSNFYLWNGVSAIFFSNFVTNVHSHNTMQILVDIHDKFKCRIGDTPWLTCKNLIIKEDIPHQLDTNGSVQLIIYLDVETAAAKAIKARYPGEAAQPDFDLFAVIPTNLLQQVLLKPDPTILHQIIAAILQALAGENPNKKTDPRIREIEQAIQTTRPDELTTTTLAATIHLSESRLRALFKEHTGVSLHKYILWSRIRYAINKIMTGHPINDAAWEAGFTDNSHFHKMLVGMFGISPSQFLKDNKKMEIFTCDQSPLDFETKVYDANGQVERVYK